MKTPPFLLAASVLLWGVEAGHPVMGLLAFLIISWGQVQGGRWQLETEDFVRVSDLTSILFLAAAALILLHVDKLFFLKTLIVWQPLVLLPLVLAQVLTGEEKIVIGTRIGLRRKRIYAHEPLDFRPYYLGVCLVATAMANSRSLLFFPGAAGILLWLAAANRGRRFPWWVFVATCLVAVAGGYWGARTAEQMHGMLRDRTRQFFRSYYSGKFADPFLSHLSYGKIGQLKLSSSIVLRVDGTLPAPSLLRQNSYETYRRNTWHSNKKFDYLVVRDLGWDLLPQPHHPGGEVSIEYYLPKEKGVLPQPYGSYRVDGKTLYELARKSDGVIRIIDGAPLVSYDIRFNRAMHPSVDPPTYRHLAVQAEDRKYLEPIVQQLQLGGLAAADKIERVRRFFAEGFSYSTRLQTDEPGDSALELFLSRERRGYCEIFATATALLLRQTGVPTRYVTGFHVAERSVLEDKFVVRDRHSHAWAEAFVGGQWIVVDTTPADWLHREEVNRSRLQTVKDFFSYLRLQYEHFRIGTEQNYKVLLTAVVVVLAVILLVRIYRRVNARSRAREPGARKTAQPVIDSPFYRIVERLSGYGMPPQRGEPFVGWMTRVARQQQLDTEKLFAMFALHQRLRFDPQAIDTAEQHRLEVMVEQWLARQDAGDIERGTLSAQD